MQLSTEFLLGVAAGVAGLIYSWYTSRNEEKHLKLKQNHRLTPDDLSKLNGEGFRFCFIALEGKLYDVTADKKRFITAKVAGKSLTALNDNSDGTKLIDEFVKIGYSVADIQAKFPVVGTLLIRREFTVEELKQYDGSGDKPAYICAKGMIYDVDKNFYGPDGPYGLFAGRDASRALAKVSLEKDDLENTNLDDLTFNEKHTLEDWVAKFEMKYTKVGYLKK